MKQKMIFGVANTGIGFWTSICCAFCNLLGKESLAYKAKQRKVLSKARLSFQQQLSNFEEPYKITDVRTTWSGHLSVTISGVVEYQKEKTK